MYCMVVFISALNVFYRLLFWSYFSFDSLNDEYIDIKQSCIYRKLILPFLAAFSSFMYISEANAAFAVGRAIACGTYNVVNENILSPCLLAPPILCT